MHRPSHALIAALAPALAIACGSTPQHRPMSAPVPVGGPVEASPPRMIPPAPGRDQPAADRTRRGPPEAVQQPPEARPTPMRLRWFTVPVAGGDLWLRAPEDAQVRDNAGITTVFFGAGFSIEIRKSSEDLQTLQRLARNSPVHPLRAIVVRAPDALVYETDPAEVGGPAAVNVIVIKELGGQRYRCENTTGYAHDLAQATAMLAACRSLTLERGATEAF